MTRILIRFACDHCGVTFNQSNWHNGRCKTCGCTVTRLQLRCSARDKWENVDAAYPPHEQLLHREQICRGRRETRSAARYAYNKAQWNCKCATRVLAVLRKAMSAP